MDHTDDYSSDANDASFVRDPSFNKRWSLPGFGKLERAAASLSPAEKMLVYTLGGIMLVASFVMLFNLNSYITSTVPSHGGSLTEGIVGTPRFINPILATSDADRDLVALTFSGLLRAMPDGTLIADLAESYEVSEDGSTYTFTIREDAVFHDGEPVTAEDVLFTIQLAKSPDYKSPRRASWEGVEASLIDERTVQFTLPRAYAPFLENATLGILPEHLWEMVESDEFPFHQLNTHPVGSGPFEVRDVRLDSTGAPTRYTLRSFDDFALGEPYLNTIVLFMYQNDEDLLEAYEDGAIESVAGISSRSLESLPRGAHVVTTPLPRVFAIYLNQNNVPLFTDKAVRQALNIALDKGAIIAEALGGYGEILEGPIPPGVLTTIDADETATSSKSSKDLEEARTLLESADWEFNESSGFWEQDGEPLSFTLTTADTPELSTAAEAIATQWRELGISVSVEALPTSALNNSIIRPREYDALLFGTIVGRTLDLFAFWHSTQRNDPGLNLALYTNTQADSLLAKARAESDRKAREEDYLAFDALVREDTPAVFLFAPDFIYVTPKNLKGVELGALTTPAERFLNVHQWHTETEEVWIAFQ